MVGHREQQLVSALRSSWNHVRCEMRVELELSEILKNIHRRRTSYYYY